MSRHKCRISAMSMFILAALSPAVVEAAPADITRLNTVELRAIFNSPAYNVICPLEVYSEDFSKAAKARL